jgi:hypothetical protein
MKVETKDIPRNVYPDHILIVALHVFANFDNASEALEVIDNSTINTKSSCPRMVASDKVPGSGEAAWSCARMIREIKDGKLSPETACIFADGIWVGLVGPGTNNFENRLKDGLAAGYNARGKFLDAVAKWDWS